MILHLLADATRKALKALAGQASLSAPLCGPSSLVRMLLQGKEREREEVYRVEEVLDCGVCVCVCVCVICTFRGGSLCSVGPDAPFGSSLLRPLWNVGPLPSAESEPLRFVC